MYVFRSHIFYRVIAVVTLCAFCFSCQCIYSNEIQLEWIVQVIPENDFLREKSGFMFSYPVALHALL